MGDNQRYFSLYGRAPLYQLLVSGMIVIGMGLLLFSLSLLAGILLFGMPLEEMTDTLAIANANEIDFLRYLLVSQGISFFIVPGFIILSLLEPGSPFLRKYFLIPGIKEIGLVIVLAFCILPVSSFTGQLNSYMHLPDWLSGIEQWMVRKEDNVAGLFDQLIPADSFQILILNLLMIAIIPGIGEELIFRGVLQKIGYSLFRSKHVAVWVTAFIFSAIHLQFFGFIPRFILGLVFGYLYLWSGTLWLPVIAHFINNAVPVLSAYLKGWESMNFQTDHLLWKQIAGLPIPVLIGTIILIYFRNRGQELMDDAGGNL